MSRGQCVLVADIPWAYPGTGFTKVFDLKVGWLAVYLPRSTVSEYMRIDWETVGRCVHRTLNDIEPERSRRLDGLVNIGIDETSYKKGHKYITVIVNHDTNTVVWAAQQKRPNAVLQTAHPAAAFLYQGSYRRRCEVDHGMCGRIHPGL